MGRACSVCSHPKRNQLEGDLLNGMSMPKASKKYKVPLRNIKRHRQHGHLAAKISKAKDLRDIWDARAVLQEIVNIRTRVLRYADACDEYLADPVRKGKYYLGPRAEDIEVVYGEEQENGKLVMRKALLSELLQKVENVFSVRVKHADPRDLFLKAADSLKAQLELIAKIQEHIKEAPINLFMSAQWLDIKAVIMGATQDAPSVRTRIVDGLRKIAGD